MEPYFNLILSEDIKQLLDARAMEILASRKPLALPLWLQKTPEGKALQMQIRSGKFNHLTIEEINKMVKHKYAEATGGGKKGRPRLAITRAEIIEAALRSYL